MLHTNFLQKFSTCSGEKADFIGFAIYSIGSHLGFLTRLNFPILKPFCLIMLRMKFGMHECFSFREKVIWMLGMTQIVNRKMGGQTHWGKNSHQRRWQIPWPKAAWAWVNLANSILLKMKLDLSFLYALYWHYLFNRCMIIKHWAKVYVKLPKGGKIPNSSHLHMVQ